MQETVSVHTLVYAVQQLSVVFGVLSRQALCQLASLLRGTLVEDFAW